MQPTSTPSFMGFVKSILHWEHSTAPSLQEFQFDMCLGVMKHNWSTIQSFERSLEKVVAFDPNSIFGIWFGIQTSRDPHPNPEPAPSLDSLQEEP
jgi:hypothetical protein